MQQFRCKMTDALLEPAKLRSIYVKVKPAPTSLTERRFVLRALQEHGEIEVFQKLRDPNSFISITTQASTAETLIGKSPLKIEFTRPPPYAADPASFAPWTDDGVRPSFVPVPVGSPPLFPRDAAPAAKEGEKDAKKAFLVEVFAAPDYNHKTRIRTAPLHGPWPRERSPFQANKSFITAALKAVLPPDLAAPGLRDWESGTFDLEHYYAHEQGQGQDEQEQDHCVNCCPHHQHHHHHHHHHHHEQGEGEKSGSAAGGGGGYDAAEDEKLYQIQARKLRREYRKKAAGLGLAELAKQHELDTARSERGNKHKQGSAAASANEPVAGKAKTSA